MIQTQISSFNQETLSHPPSSFTSNPPDQDNFEYSDQDDGEYEENDPSQYLYSGEEETEDYPIVYYHLPTTKPDLKQEKLKVEKLKERNHQIQQKKEQAKHHPPQPLNFLKLLKKIMYPSRKSASCKDHLLRLGLFSRFLIKIFLLSFSKMVRSSRSITH